MGQQQEGDLLRDEASQVMFEALRDALKRANPTISVSVRRLSLPDSLCGDCRRKPDHFLIRVNRKKPEQVQLDTLVHEFAHAIAFLEWEETHAHGSQWAQAHLQCYHVYEKIISA
jgi:hypothetical protein